MGQKINPTGLRVGIIKDWESRWFADKDYADLLHEDYVVREYIEKRLKDASVSKVEIERAANRLTSHFTLLSLVWLSVKAVLKSKHFVKTSLTLQKANAFTLTSLK